MTTSNRLLASVLTVVITAGCGRQPDTEKSQPESLDVTHWTERTELFMEYPPLVAGQSALFAVHLTRLADFKPVTAGQVRLEFVPMEGGGSATLTGPKPSRPGAFRVEGPAPAAGRYRWALVLTAPDESDRHDLGEVQVFRDERSATAEAPHVADDPSAIAYLKEQQWTNEFATERVRMADVRSSLRAPAVLEALPGGDAVVSAPAPGRLVAERLPSVGDDVGAGGVLARLEPRLTASGDRVTLVAAVAEAEAGLDAAQAELARATRLLADRAVPARRVEDAKRAATVAESRLDAARARLSQRDQTLRTGGSAAAGDAFLLRAPIAGRITEVMATIGAAYEEGAPLFRIARTDALELNVFVPATEVRLLRELTGVALETPGHPDPLTLRYRHVHHPGALDPKTKALPVQLDVDNRDQQLLIGQSGTAILFTQRKRQLPVVPKAAVLMEAGRAYVFVQVGGERFARRFIDIAGRDGELVGIRNGVTPGDRVVTRGAYEMQLASAAKGLPAEGHVH